MISRNIATALVLATAAFAGSAFADDITIATTPFASSKTRPELQAGSLEQTASTMEELTTAGKENANNARLPPQLAAEAQQRASNGRQGLGPPGATIESIPGRPPQNRQNPRVVRCDPGRPAPRR